jgi:NAD-dependent dihydropyrimidine dehydrogenase PreA subunit
MGRLVYLKNVVTLKLDQEKCVGCGMCLVVCPHAVLRVTDGMVRIEDRDACMECGACVQNCPTEAVSVRVGVGCAQAVINSMLGRDAGSCCCVLEPEKSPGDSGVCSDTPNPPLGCC